MKANFSGSAYEFLHYGIGEDGRIDYDAAERMALETRPRLIVCGSSSYPRLFDAQRLRSIADRVGAYLLFDLSHEAGLIAGGAVPNPVPLADVTTMSLDKTLRGPFGGLILCRGALAESIDKGVHPGTQSSFSVRKISEAAHALVMTQTPEFKAYAHQTLANAKVLERHFAGIPELLVAGGTDKHYVVLKVKAAFGVTGERAEQALERIGILSSRQTVPTDTSRRMADAGGLRLGTAWATSRGYVDTDIEILCTIVLEVLAGTGCPGRLSEQVAALAARRRVGDVWAAEAAGSSA
jgi:glycine hydroxymethyltransferase